jgi:hypothetical protein
MVIELDTRAKAVSVCVGPIVVGDEDGAKMGVDVGTCVGDEVAVGSSVNVAVGSVVEVIVGIIEGVTTGFAGRDGSTVWIDILRDSGVEMVPQAKVTMSTVRRTISFFIHPRCTTYCAFRLFVRFDYTPVIVL